MKSVDLITEGKIQNTKYQVNTKYTTFFPFRLFLVLFLVSPVDFVFVE